MVDLSFVPLEVIPDAALIIGRDGTILSVNEHAERLFGFATGGLVGLTVERLLPERFRKKHTSLRGKYFASPVVGPMGAGREFLALRADGQEISVEVAIGPTDPDEQRTLVIARDLTASVKLREDLTISEQRFRAAAESTADLIWEADEPDDAITWFGDIDGMLGYEPGEFPRTISGWLESIHPDDVGVIDQAVQHAVASGDYYSPDYRIRCKDGTYRCWEDRGKVTEIVEGKSTKAVGAITDITDRVRTQTELKRATAELAALRDRLQAESEYLQEEIKNDHNFEEIVGNSGAMLVTLHKVDQVAATDSTVLLLGETGTGKELLARAVHSRSLRKDRPLIKVDCATLPAGLIESELFGHEKGSFTGAHDSKAGRFELANGGTIFLDEIGELPLELQSKLLRVLEDGRCQRLGAKQDRAVDVRVIAATNRVLRNEIHEGRFRSDLYYRLGVFLIESPPLRERREDIPLLVSFYVSRCSATLRKTIRSVDRGSLDRLVAYDWPGNIRELQNVIERSAILCTGETLTVTESLGSLDSSPGRQQDSSLKRDLHAVERANILRALEGSNWKIKGEGNAASRLGLKPSTLRSRMKRLQIERP